MASITTYYRSGETVTALATAAVTAGRLVKVTATRGVCHLDRCGPGRG